MQYIQEKQKIWCQPLLLCLKFFFSFFFPFYGAWQPALWCITVTYYVGMWSAWSWRYEESRNVFSYITTWLSSPWISKPVLRRIASWSNCELAPAPAQHQVPVGGKGVFGGFQGMFRIIILLEKSSSFQLQLFTNSVMFAFRICWYLVGSIHSHHPCNVSCATACNTTSKHSKSYILQHFQNTSGFCTVICQILLFFLKSQMGGLIWLSDQHTSSSPWEISWSSRSHLKLHSFPELHFS